MSLDRSRQVVAEKAATACGAAGNRQPGVGAERISAYLSLSPASADRPLLAPSRLVSLAEHVVLGTSSAGFRSKKPSGFRMNPARSIGITGQSSGLGT
jgi:hypothetical protein